MNGYEKDSSPYIGNACYNAFIFSVGVKGRKSKKWQVNNRNGVIEKGKLLNNYTVSISHQLRLYL